MLEKIRLINFQKHKRLTIDFDSMVTTITGSNDVGKSSVLRAIKWIALNRPNTKQFITHGEKESTVTLKVDGHTIKRSKGKANNYVLDKGKPFKAVGTSVPEPISKLLSISPLNFQTQYDTPFWFDETPGEVSRQLNAIVDMGIIDDATSFLSAELRNAQAEKRVLEARQREAAGNCKRLKKYIEISKELSQLEPLEDDKQKNHRESTELAELLSGAKRYLQAVETTGEAALAAKSVEKIAISLEKIEKRGDILKNLIESARNTKQRADKRIPNISGITDFYTRLKRTTKRTQILKVYIDSINSKTEKISEVSENIERLNNQFEKLMGERCPLCHKKL